MNKRKIRLNISEISNGRYFQSTKFSVIEFLLTGRKSVCQKFSLSREKFHCHSKVASGFSFRIFVLFRLEILNATFCKRYELSIIVSIPISNYIRLSYIYIFALKLHYYTFLDILLTRLTHVLFHY